MGEETEYDVFLSYKTQDRDAVEHIARRLSDESGLRPFFDLWCLGAGEEWQPGLERALNVSHAIAVFLSAGGTGPWQTPEQQLALKKATEAPDKYIVIPVLLRGADPARITDTFLGLRGWVDFRGSIDDDKALERLVAGIKGTASVPPIRTLPDEPVPYRGLRRFEQDSADYFFGRDQDIKKLVEHVHRHPFTAVIGASGSGKSSLVRAGLLPRLAQEASTSSEAWRLVVCQPGSQPFRELAAQLADRLPAAERLTAKTQYEQALRAGPAGLADVLRSWSGGHRVLLVVDQFEELFTQTKDKAEAEGLIEGIMALAAASVSSLRVVITLRADFLGSCLDIAGLPELLESRQILLGELGPDALRAAIEEPAKKVGASFEPELVEHILSDVADERGILPMLQEALLQLWKERRGPWLTWDAYKKHEGVAGAVQAHADHVYDNLTPQQQEIARDIFLRLTTLGEGVADTRRRVDRAELALHGVPAAAVDETLAALSHRDARLITADTGKDETQTYEVTHETLIKQWPKLRNWLRDNRDALRLHHQLAERARAYAKAKERRETSVGEAAAQGEQEDPTGHLLRKGLLEEAERLTHDPAVRLSEQEQAFLDASIQERERAEAREERQRQRLRRRATLATILAVLAVGIGGAAVYLAHSEGVAKQRAVRAEADAERRALEANLNLAQAHEAEVQGRLNEPAAERSTGDYQQALLQALAAQQLPIGGRESLSFETRDALSAAALQRGFAGRWVSPALTLGSEVDAVVFNPSEPLLASASRDQAIRLWQASTGALLRTLPGHQRPITDLAFSPEGRFLASASEDQTLRLWDLAACGLKLSEHTRAERLGHLSAGPALAGRIAGDGSAERVPDRKACESVLTLEGHYARVTAIAFSPDGQTLASASHDGSVRLWQGRDAPPRIIEEPRQRFTALAYSPDGLFLVGASEQKLYFWDPATGSTLITVAQHGNGITDLAFNAAGDLLAGGAKDHGIHLWHIEREANNVKATYLRALEGHTDEVTAVAFDRTGSRLASASKDATLRSWDPTTGQLIYTLKGHGRRVMALAFNRAGTRLVSASWDQTIRFWDTQTGAPVHSPEGHGGIVTAVAFNSAGDQLASASRDRTLRLWDPLSGQLLRRIDIPDEAWINGLAFSRDGLLAGASTDATVRLWDTTTEAPPQTLRGHTDRVSAVAFSPDGELLASASKDQTVRVWNLGEGNTPQVLTGHTDKVNAVAFSPDGKRLASGARDNTVRIWDLDTSTTERTLTGHDSQVWGLAFNQDGSLLASASADRTVRLWNPATGTLQRVLNGHDGWVMAVAFGPDTGQLVSAAYDKTLRVWDVDRGTQRAILDGHHGAVMAVAVSPAHRLVASGSQDHTLRLWDTPRQTPELMLKPHPVEILGLALSPANSLLATAGADGNVRLWEPGDDEPLHTLAGHRQRVTAVAFSCDGRLASASSDETIRLWDPVHGQPIAWAAQTGEPFDALTGHTDTVNALAFSADGALLASGSADRSVRLWEPRTGKLANTLRDAEDAVLAVAFSPAEDLLAAGLANEQVLLWDLANGTLRYALDGHRGAVTAVAFDPKRGLLASASRDRTIRLWHPQTGEALGTLIGHDNGIAALAFSPAGDLLVSASEDRTLRVWDPISGRTVRILRGHRGSVQALAIDSQGASLASAAYREHRLRLWDLRPSRLLANGDAPSARATLLSEVLQRLWGLRMQGLAVEQESCVRLLSASESGHAAEVRITAQPLAGTSATNGASVGRTVSIDPLLRPPPAGADKLDQFLAWLQADAHRLNEAGNAALQSCAADQSLGAGKTTPGATAAQAQPAPAAEEL